MKPHHFERWSAFCQIDIIDIGVLYTALCCCILQGRDFESIYTNHRYTAREREVLASHDSFDYLPSHSAVYKQWLTRQPSRFLFIQFAFSRILHLQNIVIRAMYNTHTFS